MNCRVISSRCTLFGDVEPLSAILIVVTTTEDFPEDRIIRFLHTLRFDVPPAEVISQNGNEAFFWVIDLLRPKNIGQGLMRVRKHTRAHARTREQRMRALAMRGEGNGINVPENEVRVGHEICNTLEHAARLQYECGECDSM